MWYKRSDGNPYNADLDLTELYILIYIDKYTQFITPTILDRNTSFQISMSTLVDCHYLDDETPKSSLMGVSYNYRITNHGKWRVEVYNNLYVRPIELDIFGSDIPKSPEKKLEKIKSILELNKAQGSQRLYYQSYEACLVSHLNRKL